jgi:hypothetical protein
VEDVLVQATVPAADLLLVSDPTLVPDVLDALPVLLDAGLGSGADWHVGLTTTELGGTLEEVGLVSWIDFDVADPAGDMAREAASFSATGALGAIGAVDAALNVNPLNTGYRRADVPLHILIVAEADDATPAADPVAFLDALQASTTAEVQVSVYVPTTATLYLDLASSTDGLVSDLDTESLLPFAAQSGLDALGVTRTFALTADPVPGTIEVEVDDGGATLAFEETTDWAYDATDNTITFHQYVPSPGATVRLTYEAQP